MNSLSDQISQACRRVADESLAADQKERQAKRDKLPAKAAELFQTVKAMDVQGAKDIWASLGERGPEALGLKLSDQDGARPEDLFSWWWRGTKAPAQWSIPPERRVEMLLWLDEIGASMRALDDPAPAVGNIAQGGAVKKQERQETLRLWAYQCEARNLGPESTPALVALSQRWLGDPDPSCRIHPQDFIDAAFLDSNQAKRPLSYLKFAAQVWPSFGFDPAPGHWREIAQGWMLCDAVSNPLVPITRLLRLGSYPLEPQVVARLATMAVRCDGVRLLQELAKRSDPFPLIVDVLPEDSAFFQFFRPRDPVASLGETEALSPIRRDPQPCPLLAMAAWTDWGQASYPSGFGLEPSLVFDALAQIPQAASESEFGRPEWIAPIDHRRLACVYERLPQWFKPDEHGDNVLHALARTQKWEALAQGALRVAAQTEGLSNLLGQRNAKGHSPLDEIQARMLQSGGPQSSQQKELAQEIEALAEAAQLREAARPAAGPASAARL